MAVTCVDAGDSGEVCQDAKGNRVPEVGHTSGGD